MSAASDTLEQDIRTHMFRTGSWTKPTVLAFALGTSAPNDATTGAWANEVANSGSYARVDRPPLDANWTAPDNTGGLTDNAADITFATATGSWGTVSHFIIASSTTHNGGSSYIHGALTASKTVGSGDVFKFATGAMDITIA